METMCTDWLLDLRKSFLFEEISWVILSTYMYIFYFIWPTGYEYYIWLTVDFPNIKQYVKSLITHVQ